MDDQMLRLECVKLCYNKNATDDNIMGRAQQFVEYCQTGKLRQDIKVYGPNDELPPLYVPEPTPRGPVEDE